MGMELRARAAVASLSIATLAFDPGQKRGPDGQWVKGGSPALPSLSESRRASGANPRAWLDHVRAGNDETPEISEQARELFEYQDPETGFQARVTDVMSNRSDIRPALIVQVSIRDSNDREVGYATRFIWPDLKDPSRVEAHHASFTLDEQAQGGGFSSRWLKQMEQRYRDVGVDQIGLSTDGVGGYAWAKAGFDFDDAETAELQADLVRNRLIQKGLMTPELDVQVRDMKRRATTGNEDERPTPMEMAMLGWAPGAASWPGKEAMLGTHWTGVKQL